MPLELQSRRVGDIIVVKCSGRIVAGPDAEALQQMVAGRLPHDRDFLLNLENVNFIDSSGIGTLVRLHTRAQAAHGNLKLCSLQPVIEQLLRLTHLHTLLEAHPSEAEAVTAFYTRARAAEAAKPQGATVLCVDKSADVLAYLRELLRRSGYEALTASNLPDAVVLLTAAKPKAVVVSGELRALTGTRACDTFKRTIESLPIIELSGDFSTADAGDAAGKLLEQVRTAIAGGVAGAS